MIQIETTVKSQVNTTIDVLISTAGSGTRMTRINADLHKALLPYEGKPILWHIINQIPTDKKIGILVGYKGKQIKDFINLIFTSRNIQFIEVDDWESEKSGTAYSLLKADSFLNSNFWYLPCDGIFEKVDFNQINKKNLFYVKGIESTATNLYATYLLKEKKIIEKFHKVLNIENSYAFTGIMNITEKDTFFSVIREFDYLEFTDAISIGSDVAELDTWNDLGNPKSYNTALESKNNFDFSKTDEFTYVLGSEILKWWPSEEIPVSKLSKPTTIPVPFPKNIRIQGQFLAYDCADGDSLYSFINKELLHDLLTWLDNTLWIRQDVDIFRDASIFYETKTNLRIDLLRPVLSKDVFNPSAVNELPTRNWEHYLEKIPWPMIKSGTTPAVIHGDLQFDNVIYNLSKETFTLIDWRPTFGSQELVGDIYYDLAKMLGGIRLNYLEIKKNNFDYKFANGTAQLEIPMAPNAKELELVLRAFVSSKGLDFQRVELLVPIIYWNMAPLHKSPFKEFLWSLGLYYFALYESFYDKIH